MTEEPQTLKTILELYNNRPENYLGPPLDVLQDSVFTEVSVNPHFLTLARQLSEDIITRASLYMYKKAWMTLISASLAVLGTSLENEICGAGLSVAAGILCAFQATQWYKGYQYKRFAMDLRSEI